MKYNFKILLISVLFSLASTANVINIPNDYITIQEGINGAVNGDTVLVADGLYIENINLKGKAITVASRFLIDNDTTHISNTIIDGSLPSHPDSGSVVSFISGEDTTSIIQGFTITGGTGTYISFIQAWDGGGIFCFNSGAKIINNYIEHNSITSPTMAGSGGIGVNPLGSNNWVVIKQNRIKYNTTQGANWTLGAALMIFSNAYIIDNILTHNSGNNHNGIPPALATGVVYFGDDTSSTDRNSVHIIGNIISHNTVSSNQHACYGGGVHGVGSQVFIKDNEITYNAVNGHSASNGGGIDVVRVGQGSEIANNYIAYNEVTGGLGNGGGLRTLGSHIKIYNNIIVHNTSYRGAGAYLYKFGHDSLINNTFANNYASVFGAGLYIHKSNPTVLNTILWDSCAQSIDAEIKIDSGSISIEYSDIKGGWTGIGNIDLDPVFADTLFHLDTESPCIDTGIPDSAYNDPDGSRNDMGAYGGPVGGPSGLFKNNKVNKLPNEIYLSQNYPNPFNPTTTIEFSIPKIEFVSLKIYNTLGQEMESLVSEKLTVGKYKYIWNAGHLASGVYYYQIVTGDYIKTNKLILMK